MRLICTDRPATIVLEITASRSRSQALHLYRRTCLNGCTSIIQCSPCLSQKTISRQCIHHNIFPIFFLCATSAVALCPVRCVGQTRPFRDVAGALGNPPRPCRRTALPTLSHQPITHTHTHTSIGDQTHPPENMNPWSYHPRDLIFVFLNHWERPMTAEEKATWERRVSRAKGPKDRREAYKATKRDESRKKLMKEKVGHWNQVYGMHCVLTHTHHPTRGNGKGSMGWTWMRRRVP